MSLIKIIPAGHKKVHVFVHWTQLTCFDRKKTSGIARVGTPERWQCSCFGVWICMMEAVILLGE